MVLSVAVANAQSDNLISLVDNLISLVDSAYAEAMSGRIPEAIRINEDGLAQVPADSLELPPCPARRDAPLASRSRA